MKKILAIVLCLAMVLGLAACKPAGTTLTAGQQAAKDGTLNVCLASEPDTLDPALNSAVDGATLVSHLFSGLAKWEQDEDGNLIKQDAYLGRTINVKGIVDYFSGDYQIKVFSPKDITIVK